MKKIAFILAFIICAAHLFLLASCRQDEPEDVFAALPDANLGILYYLDLNANRRKYTDLYTYFGYRELYEKRGEELKIIVYEDGSQPESNRYVKAYEEAVKQDSDALKYTEKYNASYRKLTSLLAERPENDANFRAVNELVKKYFMYAYFGADGYAEDYPSLMSPELYAANPAGRVRSYLEEKKTRIKLLTFPDAAVSVNREQYPFIFTYDIKFSYYTGDREVSAAKYITTVLSADYMIGLDEDDNFIIEYIYMKPARKVIAK